MSTSFSRRDFIRLSSAAAGAALVSTPALAANARPAKNKLPRWRGFNILDFFSPRRYQADENRMRATEQDFQWIADMGFDFVRLPIAYPSYLEYNPASGHDITPEETVVFREEAVAAIERVVNAAIRQGLHVNLNLHRAPGFCINAGFHEPFNLWRDEEAQKAFYTHWEMWAKRFRSISPASLSFDLVNEPCWKDDMNDQFSPSRAIPGEVYRKVAMGCLAVIHRQQPKRRVIADGNSGGSAVIPELADLPIGQSCRGYYPHYVSHYRAEWVWKNPDDAPRPVWPGTIDGKAFARASLEEFYRPWIELLRKGVGVHCGECGCYRHTPHDVFLTWFTDVLDILTEAGIGWGLWNFRGTFGLLDSERADIAYEDWHGHKLDGKLLKVLQKH